METVEKTLEILNGMKERFDELDALICAPEIIADNKYLRRLTAERAALEEAADIHSRLTALLDEYGRTKADTVLKQIQALSLRANRIILSNNEQNLDAVIQIKSENAKSAAFCDELIKMYKAYLAAAGCEHEQTAPYTLTARGAYGRLRTENGTHKDDAGAGATVLVLPKAESRQTELSDKDIRTDIFHSSGPGGQNVNKVQSAVRLTHIPTGIAVTCQDSRSQLMNKENALKALRAKVEARYKELSAQESDKLKREKIKESKQKIRVYSFTLNTVTDLRTNAAWPLKQVLGGALDGLIDSVLLKERSC